MGRRVVGRAMGPAMKFFCCRQAKNQKLTYIFLVRWCSMKVMALMRSPGMAPRVVPSLVRKISLALIRISLFPTKEANMGRIPFALALCLSLAVSTGSSAQESTPSQPNNAEVRFGDGSIVRMTLLQENIEVQTKYGKLSIPLSDVRRVEFGLHVPPDVHQQITQS